MHDLQPLKADVLSESMSVLCVLHRTIHPNYTYVNH